MRFLKGLFKQVLLASVLAYIAEAATVTTTGVWINPNPSAINVGVGTSQISWGTPPTPTASQSSYIFMGVADGAAPTDGTPFLIGTFSHLNFPIDDPILESVDLQLDISLMNGQTSMSQFLFSFDHNETPWDLANCPVVGGPGTSYVGGCPDVVSIIAPAAPQIIQLGDEIFEFTLSGFTQNGGLVNQFVTYERQANSADVFGQLNKIGEVPEPGTMMLLGSALIGLGWMRRRRQQQSRG